MVGTDVEEFFGGFRLFWLLVTSRFSRAARRLAHRSPTVEIRKKIFRRTESLRVSARNQPSARNQALRYFFFVNARRVLSA